MLLWSLGALILFRPNTLILVFLSPSLRRWGVAESGSMLILSVHLFLLLHKCPTGMKSLRILPCLLWWILEVVVADFSYGLRKLVKRANFWAKELALSNIFFMLANATVSFEQLVSNYPGHVKMVSILCPDPHFKKRHHKRRIVQKPLVRSIVNNLVPKGQVLIQSDVLEVAVDMRNQFNAESPALQHIDTIDPDMPCDTDKWLLNNPLGIRTEREIHAESEGAKIYRRLYQKQG